MQCPATLVAAQGLMSGNLPRAVGGVAGLPHAQTFDKMMSDRKHLVSVLLSFFSLLRLHVCSALLHEAERRGSAAAGSGSDVGADAGGSRLQRFDTY